MQQRFYPPRERERGCGLYLVFFLLGVGGTAAASQSIIAYIRKCVYTYIYIVVACSSSLARAVREQNQESTVCSIDWPPRTLLPHSLRQIRLYSVFFNLSLLYPQRIIYFFLLLLKSKKKKWFPLSLQCQDRGEKSQHYWECTHTYTWCPFCGCRRGIDDCVCSRSDSIIYIYAGTTIIHLCKQPVRKI